MAKKVPQTAEAYARYLYMAQKYHPYSEGGTVISMRVRAFIDGANWAARRLAKKRRALGKTASTTGDQK